MKVKSPPLLNAPAEDEGPWTKADERILNIAAKRLQRSAEIYHMHNQESELQHILELGVYLDALDYDVADDIKKIEKPLRALMKKDTENNEMKIFMRFAANMNKLGFDVTAEIEENRKQIEDYVGEEAPQTLEAFAVMRYARAKQAGLDVSKWVKNGKAKIGQEEKNMREVFEKSTMIPSAKLMLAHSIKTLDVDVTDLLEKDKKNIIKSVQQHKTERFPECLLYIQQIAMLKELGLLEAKNQKQTPEMPPLKEVGK